MTNAKHYLVAPVALLAVTIAAPGFAQTRDDSMNPARQNAVHECSVMSGKLSQQTWGKNEIHMYRGCMAERGQME